jgi:hypothetical protein
MMGNALIQPTMYFNLRHVPMFYGPYMITSVNHTIAPGTFETIIEGIRQPTASLPKIDNYIQSLKTNLLASIVEKNKQKNEEDAKTTANSVGGTTQNQTSNAVASTSEDKKLEPSNTCSELLSEKYKKYTPVDTPQETTINPKDLVTKILSRMANANFSDDGKLKYVIFATIILSSTGSDVYKSYENDFSGVDLSRDWGIISSFESKYYCMKSGGSTLLPYAVFSSIDENIDMLINRFKTRMSTVKPDNEGKIATSIAEFWFKNRLPEKKDVETADWSKVPDTDKTNIINQVTSSITLFKTLNP